MPEHVKIRKLAARRSPGPALSLSDEPVCRERQLRFIAIGAFLVLCFIALLVRKVASTVGLPLVVGGLVVLPCCLS